VAGYPSGSFLGGRPISRYEAAALLSSCLDRVSEVTDELKRLIGDLQPELARLRGKTEGLRPGSVPWRLRPSPPPPSLWG
jgi:hypothetical protein